MTTKEFVARGSGVRHWLVRVIVSFSIYSIPPTIAASRAGLLRTAPIQERFVSPVTACARRCMGRCQVPVADDRRTPGRQHMLQIGQSKMSTETMLGVLKEWPTLNQHTDYTGVFSAATGTYESYIWEEATHVLV